jgi:hypothetical protein
VRALGPHPEVCLYYGHIQKCACTGATARSVLALRSQPELCLHYGHIQKCACTTATARSVPALGPQPEVCLHDGHSQKCACTTATARSVPALRPQPEVFLHYGNSQKCHRSTTSDLLLTSSLFPCCRLAFLSAGKWYNHVTNFVTKKHFGLVDVDQKGLHMYIAVHS